MCRGERERSDGINIKATNDVFSSLINTKHKQLFEYIYL